MKSERGKIFRLALGCLSTLFTSFIVMVTFVVIILMLSLAKIRCDIDRELGDPDEYAFQFMERCESASKFYTINDPYVLELRNLMQLRRDTPQVALEAFFPGSDYSAFWEKTTLAHLDPLYERDELYRALPDVGKMSAYTDSHFKFAKIFVANLRVKASHDDMLSHFEEVFRMAFSANPNSAEAVVTVSSGHENRNFSIAFDYTHCRLESRYFTYSRSVASAIHSVYLNDITTRREFGFRESLRKDSKDCHFDNVSDVDEAMGILLDNLEHPELFNIKESEYRQSCAKECILE